MSLARTCTEQSGKGRRAARGRRRGVAGAPAEARPARGEAGSRRDHVAVGRHGARARGAHRHLHVPRLGDRRRVAYAQWRRGRKGELGREVSYHLDGPHAGAGQRRRGPSWPVAAGIIQTLRHPLQRADDLLGQDAQDFRSTRTAFEQ